MDPLSALSGAVGILSFGITVCSSLHDYYRSWKDAEENVSRMCASIEDLSKTLKLVKTAIENKEFNEQIVDQVRASIGSIEQSLRGLEKKLGKVRVVTLQNGWKDKAKAQFRRTLYPFKESTLVKLRELSSEARDNASIALHLLQVDASAVSLRQLDSLSQQTAHVSTNIDLLNRKSTSISASVLDIAGSTRETARMIDSLALYEKSKELRAWLSGQFDTTRKQDEMWKERHPDTGRWFLQSQQFRAWLEEPAQQTPRVFSLTGKSGAGKTSLTSGAVKAAQMMARDNSQIAVVYYYCSFDEAASQDPIHMVGSFISQISTLCPDVLEGLEAGFARRERPPLDDLEQHLVHHTSRSSLKTLILVDAVNECKKVEPMIKVLLRLAKSASDIRVLFTSTEEDALITGLANLSPPEATTFRMSALSADIDLYIRSKMDEAKTLQRLPPEMREEIRTVLGKNAKGMFRWVQCQIEHLSNQSTGKLVQKALRELPPDLNSTYAGILARIPRDDRRFARESLLWLSFSFRPLNLTELCETLAFEESDTTLDESGRLLDNHDLLRWCQGLITYHTRMSMITLSHSSVRTYLLSNQIKEGPASFFSIDNNDAEKLLLRKCLTYMMFKDFGKGYCLSYDDWEYFSSQWPLLNYASNHWTSHAYTLGDRLESYDQGSISNFYSTSNNERSGNFGFWVQCLYPHADIEVARDTQPLYYAASFGLRAVVASLVSTSQNLDLNAPGGRHASTALQVACFRGHYAVAKDLLDAGANPYCKDDFGRSSLFYALWNGDAGIVELLRVSLRATTDPKGEIASAHVKEALTDVRISLGHQRNRSPSPSS